METGKRNNQVQDPIEGICMPLYRLYLNNIQNQNRRKQKN